MGADLRAIGDASWQEFRYATWNRAIEGSQAIPLADDAIYIATRGVVGNVTAVRTRDGIVLFDTGSHNTARAIYDALRQWDRAPIHTIVLTHGHIDHTTGASLFDSEARSRGEPPIRVVAHANMPARFARYRDTAGWNGAINGRQFGLADFRWPTEYRAPDLTYETELIFEVGGTAFELHHGLGETDDHTWTFMPAKNLLVSGDFVIWAAPNAGNPQKVQRYARPWAQALRAMARTHAQVLVPGHGPAVFGAQRVAQLLDDGARFLETIHDQTMALMNEGQTLDEIIQAVKVPADLLTKPYLQPTYDDPEFLVRNVWRLYGGWWDGNPAHLKPAPQAALAREIAALAGGADRLCARAAALAVAGDLRLAGHLAELATGADPTNREAHRVRASINQQRAEAETTLMARAIFAAAARASRSAAGDDPGPMRNTARETGLG
jgi:alkyl sulfatase BDS1-like metallo-beta-lactamase superfamily hydrolase